MALNIQATKVTIVVAFITDVLLLIIMLLGLLPRGRRHNIRTTSTERFLWNQVGSMRSSLVVVLSIHLCVLCVLRA